jgi:hypothetical protein
VIESSTRLLFSPWDGAYPLLAQHFKQTKMDPRTNYNQAIFDFTPGHTDALPLPHYRVSKEPPKALQVLDWVRDAKSGGELGPCENPVPPLLMVEGKLAAAGDGKSSDSAPAASVAAAGASEAKTVDGAGAAAGSAGSSAEAGGAEEHPYASLSPASSNVAERVDRMLVGLGFKGQETVTCQQLTDLFQV